MEPLAESSRSIITQGPMQNEKYRLAGMHFHWGENDRIGSETTINNETFPLESHIVFYNVKYSNYSMARKSENGIVVVATIFKVRSSYINIIHAATNISR